jgi:hypothetical protein
MFRWLAARTPALLLIGALAALLLVSSGLGQSNSILAGVVRDTTGKPVAGARVTLQPSDGRLARTTKTDAEGRFAFAKVSPSLYDVRAYANSLWSDWERNVAVRSGQRAEVSLQLKPAQPSTGPSPPASLKKHAVANSRKAGN